MNRQLVVPVGDAIRALVESGVEEGLAQVFVHGRCFYYGPHWVIETSLVEGWLAAMGERAGEDDGR